MSMLLYIVKKRQNKGSVEQMDKCPKCGSKSYWIHGNINECAECGNKYTTEKR